ncbi:hypothetical protein BGX26_008554 [Mortierella sp. AD094]|nr:hypothetical protein BGX26_008554 [Mortierella sp. AD094]
MSGQITIYAIAFAGTFALIGIFIGLVVRKDYQVSEEEDREYEEGVQQRMQQVTDSTRSVSMMTRLQFQKLRFAKIPRNQQLRRWVPCNWRLFA